jgi:hypothetical protein
MNKYLLLSVGIFLVGLVSASAVNIHLQDGSTYNESNLLKNSHYTIGVNNPLLFFDGDRSTYANFMPSSSIVFINYSVPENSIKAEWTLYSKNTNTYDLTNCMLDNLQIIINITGRPYMYIYCFNGTNFIPVDQSFQNYFLYDEYVTYTIGNISIHKPDTNNTCQDNSEAYNQGFQDGIFYQKQISMKSEIDFLKKIVALINERINSLI